MDYSLTERKIPIGLIIGGELLFVVAGLIQFGSKVGLLLAYVGISTVVGTLLMLMAAYVTAAICKVSFGDLLSAALKLAGIYIFSAAAGRIPAVGLRIPRPHDHVRHPDDVAVRS